MIGLRRGAHARISVCMLACVALLAVPATAAVAQGAPDYAAIVAAPDRSDADREIDKRRDPAKLLAFTGVRAGMKVLDRGAGGGYSTELMARAVGSHIEHLHARAYAGEGEELHRIAALVDLAVRVAAVGRRHDGGVVRRGLRERRA